MIINTGFVLMKLVLLGTGFFSTKPRDWLGRTSLCKTLLCLSQLLLLIIFSGTLHSVAPAVNGQQENGQHDGALLVGQVLVITFFTLFTYLFRLHPAPGTGARCCMRTIATDVVWPSN